MNGITLYPFIFLEKTVHESQSVFRHEWIHIEQIQHYGFFRFYISYFLEFFALWIGLSNRRNAYRSISWEKDAYALESKVLIPDKKYYKVY